MLCKKNILKKIKYFQGLTCTYGECMHFLTGVATFNSIHMHVNQKHIDVQEQMYKTINYKIHRELNHHSSYSLRKAMMYITRPIPIPNTKRPITIITKLGVSAVTRAPTRYNTAATINSLLLPEIQIHDMTSTRKARY